jgi:hypothetical protein
LYDSTTNTSDVGQLTAVTNKIVGCDIACIADAVTVGIDIGV